MYEMQTITDDCGVCPSVCHSALLCKNGCTHQDAVWDEHSWVKWNIVLDVRPDPPAERGRGTHY